MPVEILMPELGESVHEGTVSRWLKQEGDAVQEVVAAELLCPSHVRPLY